VDHRCELENAGGTRSVNEAQAKFLTDLLQQMRAAHDGALLLSYSTVTSARALLRAADTGRLELTEDEKQQLDTLYGLVRWGQLVYPLQRLDPELFAKERRTKRAAPSGPQWGD
jgi:hypothetical protein